MEITFWGVRGSIPSPGPATVRYGGNTSCVSVRLGGGELLILDCGTGARNLGIALLQGPFGQGQGEATFLLSHAHWDHIQGFPFFGPFYVAGNSFTIYGGAQTPEAVEAVLERQMAAQYFPVQSIRNMNAHIDVRALAEGTALSVGKARITALANPHGETPALAFRIEEDGRAVVYASDAGYGEAGPRAEALALYRGADLLIHDSTYTPEDQAHRRGRGLSSIDDAVDVALRAEVRRLVAFHYDQDYTDMQVEQLLVRGRRRLDEGGGRAVGLVGAAEGLILTV